MTDTQEQKHPGKEALADIIASSQRPHAPDHVDWADDLWGLLMTAAEQMGGKGASNRGHALVEYFRCVGPNTIRTIATYVSELEARLEKAEDAANQAINTIEAVQNYDQPDDPTYENALTMGEHEVFDFDVQSARAALSSAPTDGETT